MKEYAAKRAAHRKPMHPGELLREDVLPALKRPKTEIATLLGIGRMTLYEILVEKAPVTPAMAVRLGKLCGNGPEIWAELQSRYDVWQARQSVDVRAIPTLHAAE